MTLYAPVLWFYAVMVSVVFGASVYTKHWSCTPRGAGSRRNPFAGSWERRCVRMDLPRVWVPVAPLYRAAWTRHAGARPFGGKPGEAIIVSAVCAIAVVAWTLLYAFIPTIERFLTGGGGNTPPERLQVEARRWIWAELGPGQPDGDLFSGSSRSLSASHE